MNPIFLTLFQAIVVLGLAPFAVGCVRFFKARLQGRRGASPFLPYVALATLLRKQMVISDGVSWVFRLTPYVVLASGLFIALVLPLAAFGGALDAYGDMFVVAGVLVLGAVFLVMGGLDAGSAFGGMGASREMTLTSLLEPTVIVTFATLALASRTTSVGGMLASGVTIAQAPYLVLTLAALGLVALAENARYPVDNPATHLELTMVHEAMILEYSGPYLAMLEYASALKLTAFALLIGNILVPATLAAPGATMAGLLAAAVAAVVKLVAAMAVLALLESVISKMRFYRMQEYMTGAFLLALGGLALSLIQRAV
ncbi:MAG TPA: NADH-quinone oxidoreductase subunit H [Patescibacteria group bacterium]|nr:NADH-quinone oxidoreductase subunit H [Patescibacteria group bacterium]